MAVTPGTYGGFGVRPRAPGNARRVTPEVLAQESNQRIMAAAEAAIAEPFVGLTTGGDIIPGLYSIQSTGSSTQPIVETAQALLAALAPDEAARLRFDVD